MNKRQMDFLIDVSFTQLLDKEAARKMGYNAQTWNMVIEFGGVYLDGDGYFNLTTLGRNELRAERQRQRDREN